MNRLQKILGTIAALTLCGCAGANGLQGSAGEDAPPFAIRAYQQPSADAELMYHILAGEIAGRRGQLDKALENYQIAARTSNNPRIVERTVGIALFLRNNAVALEMARRWYALQPDNNQARQALALALLRNALVEESIAHLEAVRKASSKDGQEGYATVSVLLGQVEDKEVMFKTMHLLRERQPRSRFALYYYSLVAFNAKEYQRALEGLGTVLARHPKWAPAQLLKARVMVDMGDAEAALKSLAAAVAASPKDAMLRTGYARLLVGAGRFREARQQFQVIAKQNPKDVDALFSLGLLAAEARDYGAAVDYLMRVLKLGKRVMEVYYELGKVEELRGDYRKARDWYARIHSGDERYLNAQVKVGAMLARLGDFTAMNAHFAHIRQSYPQNETALFISEADILGKEGRYQAAFDLLTRTLEHNPDDKDLLYNRALAAEKIDRLDVLEQDLRRLLEADPDNGQVLNALGYTLADRTDRYQEALGYLQRAITLLPNDPAVLDSMGWVHYRLGNHEESLRYLRRAYELNKDGEITAHLVEVLWVTGQQNEARKIWRRGLEENPKSEHLRKVKERFGW